MNYRTEDEVRDSAIEAGAEGNLLHCLRAAGCYVQADCSGNGCQSQDRKKTIPCTACILF